MGTNTGSACSVYTPHHHEDSLREETVGSRKFVLRDMRVAVLLPLYRSTLPYGCRLSLSLLYGTGPGKAIYVDQVDPMAIENWRELFQLRVDHELLMFVINWIPCCLLALAVRMLPWRW